MNRSDVGNLGFRAAGTKPSTLKRGRTVTLNRPSPVVRRPSSVARRPSSVVRRTSSVVRRPSSVVRRPSSVVRRPSSVFRRSINGLCVLSDFERVCCFVFPMTLDVCAVSCSVLFWTCRMFAISLGRNEFVKATGSGFAGNIEKFSSFDETFVWKKQLF